MRIKKISNKLRVAAMTVAIIACAALVTMAIERRAGRVAPLKKKIALNHPATEPPPYDSILLRKFLTAIHSLDFNKHSCTYQGTINMDDGNDTTNSVRNIRFLFCRAGEDYYYRIGNTEIIHRGNLNIYIQHDQQKVVLSNQVITIKPPMSNLGFIEKGMRSENYAFTSRTTGKRQTLAFINEHHISCKELSITVDSVSGKLERIYSRLTDFGSPADKNKDRVMDVSVSEIKNEANMDLYPAATDIIRQSAGKWKLTPDYKGYELILL